MVVLGAVGCAKAPATPTVATPRPTAAASVPPDVAAEPPQVVEADASQPAPCTQLEVCVAQVGDVVIPYAAFDEVYALKVEKYTSRGRTIPSSADRRYRRSITARLIYHEVLAQEVARVGASIDPDELARRGTQARRGIADWPKHLERRGESDASLRAMYIAELHERAILAQRGALDVAPEEIETEYEKIKANWVSDKARVRASHILVSVGDPDFEGTPSAAQEARWDAAAKAEAQKVYALASAPDADFAALAVEHSSGPSANRGGDLGIFNRERMVKPFADAAFSLRVGEVSKPVRTKFGYHIIKLSGSWGPGALPLQALQDQIEQRLEQRKLHEGRRVLREELLRRYEIIDNMEPRGADDTEALPMAQTQKCDTVGIAFR